MASQKSPWVVPLTFLLVHGIPLAMSIKVQMNKSQTDPPSVCPAGYTFKLQGVYYPQGTVPGAYPQGDASVAACGTACKDVCWCSMFSWYAVNRVDTSAGACFLYHFFLSGGSGGATQGNPYDIMCELADTSSLSFTCPPTPSPTPSPASGTGDPHLQNIHGQRFDLMKPGTHVLVNIPKGEVQQALLRVSADARRLGGCNDMYFQEINITGSWAEDKQVGGYHYVLAEHAAENPKWTSFGKVQIKVVQGRTQRGLSYFNFFVKNLGQAGFAVGGLLGEDDHTEESRVPVECTATMSLLEQ